MPNSTLPRASFSQIVNHPTTYMLMVAVGLLSYFVYAFTGSTERGNQNCEAEKKALRDDNLKKDQRIEVLTNAILYYRGVNVEMKKITDSVVRETVGNEAKKIVE